MVGGSGDVKVLDALSLIYPFVFSDEDCLLPELSAVMAFASFNTLPPNCYVFSKT
ncbi:hypothetical protein Bca101_016519 [Brassica carinata]